jgi:hypothetical protein
MINDLSFLEAIEVASVIPAQNVLHPHSDIYTHFNIIHNYIELLDQFIRKGSGAERVAHVPCVAFYELQNGSFSRRNIMCFVFLPV